MTDSTRFALVLALLFCHLLAAYSVLFVIAMFVPMQRAFFQEFQVANQSGEVVWVTPIGVTDRVDTTARSVLPLFQSKSPSIPAFRTQNLVLLPGQKRWFLYNWDDIQFSEIVVVNQHGVTNQVVVDSNPTRHMFSKVDKKIIQIPNLSRLSMAKPYAMVAITSIDRAIIKWIVVFLGFVSLFLIKPLLKACRK